MCMCADVSRAWGWQICSRLLLETLKMSRSSVCCFVSCGCQSAWGELCCSPQPLSLDLISSPCLGDKAAQLFALLIYSPDFFFFYLSDRSSRKRLSPFALTFEFYQTEVLSNHRWAVDSDTLPFVRLSPCAPISTLFSCQSWLCHFFVLFYALLSLIVNNQKLEDHCSTVEINSSRQE